MSFFQCAVNLGILTAFWIQYGTSHIAGSAAWRIPMGLQMIVSALFLHLRFVYSFRLTTKGYRVSPRCHVVHARISQMVGAA